ncbi:SIR2 family NAD-dependent protein deacylase [Opitutus terrae]|uniref:NAD-dependent protein deacylase n=1 Tax=Opitutus terrae (strain DSM 11246 / JCM 15787 / PB90-1) TaxID=452637 RepID=B1ZQZ4_OPITP|nr:NAD-dependent deacylase [Opitutus terrae]ACB73661.1 Silent information regulator protein Sir2 [Opitutus terrae PB90-1]
MQQHLVVLSGAGMSAESGIPTFRGANGLWENHRIEDVASPAGWARDRATVLRFYNERRKKMWACEPNAGHRGLAALEQDFRVSIVTQNIDNLHERAGSTRVLHLHGELTKSRSTVDPSLVYDIEGWELKLGDRCAKGSQLRPHIVWFGEDVPLLGAAAEIVSSADILVVIGTSLQVYPAASLIDYAPDHARVFLIDPHPAPVAPRVVVIPAGASEGVTRLRQELLP